ncbi:hypothetical protein TREMEDRAFT_36289 [Tremella mesenterica DSM 1558]|uniref:uncharacterized protein n=1 Tax=Tremella mesenterica (strain ATCC 24925 / CBS 8224 / DSM 1558 / NBRC 9311 / NRRL Y-6157 / RJB 2259-6 / UBC 559-6) TaxID=578456 RepID=UPI00032C0AD6|nr:uncharacterized protein TREMEDRAFT_36289 [Tremella mesenterica DSM 1558]EIW65449.1 hypothetical protein TREMEDRAFT_36289 [Tremella mesenterica DSM 1558]
MTALNNALAAAKISSPKSTSKEILSDDSSASHDGVTTPREENELEDGEIQDDEETEADDGRPKTIFDSKSKFNVKHPLFSSWTLFFDSPQSKLLPKTPTSAPASNTTHGWMDDIRKVVTFESVEEFWGLYNNIVPPSQLPQKANYYLFKDGIMPAWEDAQNKDGGKWSLQVPREKNKGVIDKMWLYTMLAAIGETFETPLPTPDNKSPAPKASDLVTGVIVSARPGFYRISIWTRNAPDVSLPDTDELKARTLTIGRHFKVSVLGYDLDQKLVQGGFQTEVTFESHANSEKKNNRAKIVV